MSRFESDLREDFLRIGGGRSRNSTTPTATPSFTARSISFTRHKWEPGVVGKKCGGEIPPSHSLSLSLSLTLSLSLSLSLSRSLSYSLPRTVHLTGRFQSGDTKLKSKILMYNILVKIAEADLNICRLWVTVTARPSPPPRTDDRHIVPPQSTNFDKTDITSHISQGHHAIIVEILAQIKKSDI
ncbi:hypothetical protein J6590_025250 [Homalodisca vitripennis]|nr:hypothetical protein J6590_025250 [Homalodisca vitripennis]